MTEDGKPYGLVNRLQHFCPPQPGGGSAPAPPAEDASPRSWTCPAGKPATRDIPQFQTGSRIRDALNRVLREEGDDFWVVDEAGLYVGVCRQRDVLNPPRLRLILVDHNEPRQALGALDEAELVEILDHHRLG